VELVKAKLTQAAGLLAEVGWDAWMVQFGRETGMLPDPIQELCVGVDVTWPSAFLLHRSGESVALVGDGDVELVRSVGAYSRVEGYTEGLGEPLRRQLASWQVGSLAANYSKFDPAADGLTHGAYLLLLDLLKGLPCRDGLLSSEPLVRRLREIKLEAEVLRIKRAVEVGEELFREVAAFLEPGVTEAQLHGFVREQMRNRGLGSSWDEESDPGVTFGPKDQVGHGGGGDVALREGETAFVDLGVVVEGYACDLQRTFYILREDEEDAPANVRAAFDAVRGALQTGFDALRPGLECTEVDAVARAALQGAGMPAPPFAFGHHLGRRAHDGGGVLGPPWERYGDAPHYLLEEGNVLALEFAAPTTDPHVGWVSLEENVHLSAQGPRWLSEPQERVICL
jgi:Xaa-Pro aminopeptidase